MDETLVPSVADDLLLAITNAVVDVLERGFQPYYLVLGEETYTRLVYSDWGGCCPTKWAGMHVVVDSTQAHRVDVLPRADFAIAYAGTLREAA